MTAKCVLLQTRLLLVWKQCQRNCKTAFGGESPISLSGVERRYSQTEKEALELLWACERFSLYAFGKKFELKTDHKPLKYNYAKTSKPSARIERWVLRLQSYDFDVV